MIERCAFCNRVIATMADWVISQNTGHQDERLCWNPHDCMASTNTESLVKELRHIVANQLKALNDCETMIRDLVFYAEHAPMCKAEIKNTQSDKPKRCTCGLNDTLQKYNNNFHNRR